VSFSSKTFIDYVIEHSSNMPKLLEVYYKVSNQLDVLALILRSLLAYIPELGESLCTLLGYEEDIAKGEL
jgi:hypothetical protein